MTLIFKDRSETKGHDSQERLRSSLPLTFYGVALFPEVSAPDLMRT